MAVRKVVEESSVGREGELKFQIIRKEAWGSDPMTRQQIVNAYNFPWTLNPGSGCGFNCIYCFLRQDFFARHIDAKHGQEMNYKADFADILVRFLERSRDFPQYLKRVQMGVATEIYFPKMREYYQPRRIWEIFRDHGPDWMVHLVTTSRGVLEDADLLAEMKHQVQIEVSLVTLDEDAAKLFERGTPAPGHRLQTIEELAKRDIFVRAMCMPVMRKYELERTVRTVKEKEEEREVETILPVYRHRESGHKVAMHKVGREGSDRGMRYFFEEEDHTFDVDIADWEPVVLHDYSKPEEMRQVVYDRGARAFKQKDLNYYYVEELVAAEQEGRDPVEHKGRFEDPSTELLEHSGEFVRDEQGQPVEVEVMESNPKKVGIVALRDGTAPRLRRRKMDYGYRFHSDIDWVDCI